jgi:hypothetical protein
MNAITQTNPSALGSFLSNLIGSRSDMLLRLIVGGMLIPHGIGKFLNFGKEVEVFGNVFKLSPPNAWVIAAAVFQIVVGLLPIDSHALQRSRSWCSCWARSWWPMRAMAGFGT